MQPIGAGLRTFFWLVALVAGLTGLTLFLIPHTAGGTLWPWPITPLVSRYLGAHFLGVAVGAAAAGRARGWGEVRLLFPPALVITALTPAAAVIHFGSFDPARMATWLFLTLYLAVFVAGALFYLRYQRARPHG